MEKAAILTRVILLKLSAAVTKKRHTKKVSVDSAMNALSKKSSNGRTAKREAPTMAHFAVDSSRNARNKSSADITPRTDWRSSTLCSVRFPNVPIRQNQVTPGE